MEVTKKVTIARIKQRQKKKKRKRNWKFDGNENFMLTIIHLVNIYGNF